jgi:entericidin A
MIKLLALLLVASVIALAGCNTMQGFGKDVETVGEKIQKKAK